MKINKYFNLVPLVFLISVSTVDAGSPKPGRKAAAQSPQSSPQSLRKVTAHAGPSSGGLGARPKTSKAADFKAKKQAMINKFSTRLNISSDEGTRASENSSGSDHLVKTGDKLSQEQKDYNKASLGKKKLSRKERTFKRDARLARNQNREARRDIALSQHATTEKAFESQKTKFDNKNTKLQGQLDTAKTSRETAKIDVEATQNKLQESKKKDAKARVKSFIRGGGKLSDITGPDSE